MIAKRDFHVWEFAHGGEEGRQVTFFSQQHCDRRLVDPHVATVEDEAIEEGLSIR